MATAPPDGLLLPILTVIGGIWGILIGLLSRPRWSGGARWWRIEGIKGLIIYGGLAGASIYVLLLISWATMQVFRLEHAFVVGTVWIAVLSLVARIGGAGPDPTRPHLLAGLICVGTSLFAVLAVTWYVERVMGGLFS